MPLLLSLTKLIFIVFHMIQRETVQLALDHLFPDAINWPTEILL